MGAGHLVPARHARRRWGRICNIGSGVAREPTTDLPHILPNTVRAPVAGLYRVLAHRLAPEGITVNNLLTGSISTERNSSYWRWLAGERGQTVDEVTQGMRASIPLRRMGYPQEMAAVVAFLCSQRAARITGQSIPVTGGSGSQAPIGTVSQPASRALPGESPAATAVARAWSPDIGRTSTVISATDPSSASRSKSMPWTQRFPTRAVKTNTVVGPDVSSSV